MTLTVNKIFAYFCTATLAIALHFYGGEILKGLTDMLTSFVTGNQATQNSDISVGCGGLFFSDFDVFIFGFILLTPVTILFALHAYFSKNAQLANVKHPHKTPNIIWSQ